MRCASLSNSVYNKKTTIKLLILNFKFMKNEFFKFSSRRILFSTVMASALLAGSPQTVFAEVNGVQDCYADWNGKRASGGCYRRTGNWCYGTSKRHD